MLRDSSQHLVCLSSLLQGTLVSAFCPRITGGEQHSPRFYVGSGYLILRFARQMLCPLNRVLKPLISSFQWMTIFCSCTSNSQDLCPAEAAYPWVEPKHFLGYKWTVSCLQSFLSHQTTPGFSHEPRTRLHRQR